MNHTIKSDKTKGLHALAEALRHEDFPIDKEGIHYAVGDFQVQDVNGQSISVRELTERLKEDEYRSVEELMKAIHSSLGFQKSKAA
jgi:DNA-binding transcriptional ArsR family regulator